MEIDYTRKITHIGYRNPEKVKKYFHRVPKMIYEYPKNIILNKKCEKIIFVLEDFMVRENNNSLNWFYYGILAGIIPSMGWGIFLVGILNGDTLNGGQIFLFCFFIALTIFFVVYGFTMPKQEDILNRRDGLMTFDGFFWQDNITMPFSEVEFCYSTGGDHLQGAFELQIMRPNKWVTFAIPIFSGKDCYEGMSFITWYMDKNRPLPPGELFDPHREADFQRRKAEGFPKPLSPSDIPTPEATPEQQAERERIGGW